MAELDKIEVCLGVVAQSLIQAVAVGSVALCAIYIFCRLFPRIPASIRFGVWWLGCAKIIISLFCVASIPLRVVVPPSIRSTFVARRATLGSILGRIALRTPTNRSPDQVTAAAASSGSPITSRSVNPASNAAPTPVEENRDLFSTVTTRGLVEDVVALAWLIGVAFNVGRAIKASAALRLLMDTAVATPPPTELREVKQILRLTRDVQWRTTPAISSPLVAGIFKPIVVFPTESETSFSRQDFRIAIAHELAHVRRRDVLLSFAPTLARCLFLFHPLVHLACRECATCREEACDAIAIAATGTMPREYATLLLRTAINTQFGSPIPAFAAQSMAASHFGQLKRRLEAVRVGARPGSPSVTMAAIAIAAVAIAVPYRIVLAAAERLKIVSHAVTLPAYDITDLGTLGGRSSDATAISDSGEIVGSANTDRRSTVGHAFAYRAASGMEDLAYSIPFRHSAAAAVNDLGEIVVSAFDRAGRPAAVLWSDGVFQTILNLPGYHFSRPAAINHSGTVVGSAVNPWRDERGALSTRAFIYSDGNVREIGTLGGNYSAATSINASGEIVGKADLPLQGTGLPSTHAFLRTPGGESKTPEMKDLGTLPEGANSVATAISDTHCVAGVSEVSGGAHHAFRVVNGRMEDLGTLDGLDSSRAYGINDSGVVVGSAYSEHANTRINRHAVMWLPKSTNASAPRIVDLNDLLPSTSPWILEAARGINNRGQIVGQGTINGEHRAFLLTPK